jgi:hypothetical protein
MTKLEEQLSGIVQEDLFAKYLSAIAMYRARKIVAETLLQIKRDRVMKYNMLEDGDL